MSPGVMASGRLLGIRCLCCWCLGILPVKEFQGLVLLVFDLRLNASDKLVHFLLKKLLVCWFYWYNLHVSLIGSFALTANIFYESS